MISFRELGTKLDNLIADILEQNRTMPWYKLYSYYVIKWMIKNNKFNNKQHFERSMNAIEKQPYAWRCAKLRQLYKGESEC